MSKAGEIGEETIISLLIAVPFQKMSTSQRTDFLDRTFNMKVPAADLIECGNDRKKIIELILNHRK